MSHHPVEDSNRSDNETFQSVLDRRLKRRDVLKGGLSISALGFIGGVGGLASLSGCSSNNNGSGVSTPSSLGFDAVARNLNDYVTLPPGYSAKVLYAFGDPIAPGVAPYANDGQYNAPELRAGDQHDGMSYFGMADDGSPELTRSDRGLLCLNHEQVENGYIHANGMLNTDAGGNRPEDEVLKEMNAHGISVIEVQNDGGTWRYLQDSGFNRRVTALTDMNIQGPARGNAKLATPYSLGGLRTRGTLNNCAQGYTPWGTYLTCEENWFSYFRRDDDSAVRSADDATLFSRYGMGVNSQGFSYRSWDTVPGDQYARFNITASGASAELDYRNEPNTFGYVVEIDPFNPGSTPRKRTALGRFAHEGAWLGPVVEGQPIVYYMGDDSRFEYIYKFVSTEMWNPSDLGGGMAAGDKYLNDGILYVAKFNDDGTGEWIELSFGQNGLDASNATFPFANQGDVCIATRLAADSVGATPMDRPEWGAVNPANGEVYMTLTNNTRRTTPGSTDAANPRNYNDSDGNINGHIIRWREDGDMAQATRFTWDIYLFGARADDGVLINVSGLSDDNDFSSADGLWFDPRGVLWVQTDDGAFPGAGRSNNQMLAALPGTVGDGGAQTIGAQDTFVGAGASTDKVRRFLVGPVGCEITGVDMVPDGTAMFVNIQHPGEGGDPGKLGSNWPHTSGDAGIVGEASNRPRSATIVITRDDGGVIGL